jgi:hypothetical protein
VSRNRLFSPLGEDAREAIVATVMARYQYRPPDLWSGIVAYAYPVVGLTAAALVAAITWAATTRPPGPRLVLGGGVPAPIARLVESPSTPTPLEVMVAMAELPR